MTASLATARTTLTGEMRVSPPSVNRRPPRTNNRSATRPDTVRRHDVGPTRAPDRTALDDRRDRDEAPAALREQAFARAEAMRGKRGTAGQRAHALPMQEPGQERLGRADAPRPQRSDDGVCAHYAL